MEYYKAEDQDQYNQKKQFISPRYSLSIFEAKKILGSKLI